jgi:hypothetical protein
LAGANIEARMPVTVKLSQRFYEKFGHDLVDEMVNWFNQMDTAYRADLRELNDVNFARFDAKLEQRLAEVKAELRQAVAELRTELRTGLATQRADMIKWMFLFWVGNVATTAGLVFGLVHVLRS